MQKEFEQFLEEYEEKVVELSKNANEAYFNASISGKEEDYKNASLLQTKLSKVYADKNYFKRIKQIKDADNIEDPILKRELELIYNDFAGHQFDEELLERIINLSTEIEQKFATYRAEVEGKKFSDNQIDDILKESTDSNELENVWKASKQIGKIVSDDVIKLVKMRNESAQKLGYKNYHEMSLLLSEQSYEHLDNLFDELDDLTKDAFKLLKEQIDEYLSDNHKIAKEELMPWHYQDKFFQQGPQIYKTDLDKYFKEQDLVKITREYFKGVNLDCDDLIDNSDLFEKEGKYQHAYCMDVDRSGDVRVVCNIKSNHRWMSTMLHEYGHAVYDKFISQKLPWSLRQPAHIFATEAIAMLFGRFASNPVWLKDILNVSDSEISDISEDCFNSLKLEQLTFSRWVQVMYRFEKEMYSNPDQDLNSVWWKLVEKYQMIKKPAERNEPDWASKIHVALYPAYYHNYMLGELLASQLYFYIKDKVLKSEEREVSFFNKPEVGEYLKHLYFSYGSLYKWNELIENATGENLNPQYYAKQFVGRE